MSDYRPLLKEAFRELKDLREKLERTERLQREPVAVVGMGCRFPGGASNPDAFWLLLRDGVDAIAEVPPDRWDAHAGDNPKCTHWGGFLRDVGHFDPAFFGISPREAASTDPQHRLFLEVAWEALENAGIAPDSLNGTRTGVFLGLCTNDYSLEFQGAEQANPYMATGNAFSVAAGRLSYLLGLQGPNIALDTACSSSLVTIHLACRSLRSGDCRMALAGGVNLILSPVSMLALSAIQALSPEGRCKTFDESADGYARGEGCGVVVLKMLSDAISDGDRILALIRGSDVNHDGRSSGLTAPNGLSQEAVIRNALKNAGAEPAQVGYVEAHGTGTSLGDPIEIGALARVFREGREKPLAVGSVKTNIGHLEAAAGVAGVIKVILALQYREIPPHLHLVNPNRRIEWHAIPVTVPRHAIPFETTGGKRIAGVSAFGFSGTNAHLILEEAPPQEPVPAGPDRPVHVLALSARTEQALHDLIARYVEYLRTTSERFEDICHTANGGRAHFATRVAIVAARNDEAISALRGAIPAHRENPARCRIAFVFKGQGGEAIAESFRQWGIEPACVLGPGAAEYAGSRFPLVSGEEEARSRGCEAFIEMGPELAGNWVRICELLASLYRLGAFVDWNGFDKGFLRRKASLPTYPFQRQRYWLNGAERPLSSQPSPAKHVYALEWRPAAIPDGSDIVSPAGHCLIAADTYAPGLAESVSRRGWTAAIGGCAEALQIIQSRTAEKLWLITRGAQPVGGSVIAPDQASLWGLGRVIALEHPELRGGIIDLDPAAPEGESEALVQAMSSGSGEDQMALRANRLYLARLAPMVANGVATVSIHADATYLLTGGTGGLGLHLVRWLIGKGARNLVLMTRSAASEAVAALQQSGTRVEIRQGDVSSASDVDRIFAGIRSGMPRLRGVFHLAGQLDDGVLNRQNAARFAKVMAPKVSGAWNLHNSSAGDNLDLFVMFSSAASILGSSGQANYASANAFLDSFAHFRRSLGLPAISISWGPWQGTERAAGTGESRRASLGIEPFAPGEALGLLDGLLRADVAHAMVARVDWVAFAQRVHLPLFADVAPAAMPARPNLPADVSREALAEYLKTTLTNLLMTSEEIAEDRNLIELGLDSLMIMDLTNDLKRSLPINLYPRELYAHPTIGALSDYLLDELRGTRNNEPISLAPSIRPAPAKIAGDKIRGALFVLSSPRAGSTLLRVMMAGHSALFCPPELHLLPFENMGARAAALGSSFLGEGLQRALMELQGLDADQVHAELESWVAGDISIHEVYRRLHDLAAPRLLVDKSPIYAGSIATLERAESLFENARYIHLVRHPWSVIDSFVRNRMSRVIGDSNGDPFDLAENIWMASNQNAAEFLNRIGPGRGLRVIYEHLVESPEREMRKICEFLGLPFEDSMLKPYEGRRMTDGVRAQSLPIGDPNFLSHRSIDRALSDVWKSVRLPRTLKPATQSLASRLGFEFPREGCPEKAEFVAEVRGLPLRVSSWGPNDAPVVLCLHGILDHGGAWELVALDLARRGFHVVAPDQRGHGRSTHASDAAGYYLMDFVADADALSRQFGERPLTLVGHSMGSAIASLLAAARPERIGSLILVECLLPKDDTAAAADELVLHLDYLASAAPHPTLPNIAEAARRLRAATPSMSEEFANRMAERLTEPRDKGVVWRWDPRLRSRAGIALDGMGTMRRARYLELLRSIRAPIALAYGLESPYANEQQIGILNKSLPDAQLHRIRGGHNLHVDSPAELAGIIAAHALRESTERGQSFAVSVPGGRET